MQTGRRGHFVTAGRKHSGAGGDRKLSGRGQENGSVHTLGTWRQRRASLGKEKSLPSTGPKIQDDSTHEYL